MPTLYDVPPEDLIEALAGELAERIEEPEWARYAKTGVSRELAPEQDDFWNHRAASLLRKVAIDGPIGVEKLRSAYGGPTRGSNRYRVAPTRQTKASGKIIRTMLQQLQEEGLVEEAGSAGRTVTPEGRQLLDDTAAAVLDTLAEDRPELQRYT